MQQETILFPDLILLVFMDILIVSLVMEMFSADGKLSFNLNLILRGLCLLCIPFHIVWATTTSLAV